MISKLYNAVKKVIRAMEKRKILSRLREGREASWQDRLLNWVVLVSSIKKVRVE